ncbi:protein YceI [Marinicella pacifica]|uniref:Protein YceI n=1 Tax=Marinicella pacifica TaxID=1171543 RepID=A0A917FM13_9GAMM|nr:YceI family protein [Marinicella pacifica]GGF88930.1 protein YceI [Marinicella pacifica]
MKKFIYYLVLGLGTLSAQAAEYDLDIKGQHAFVQFKIQHLGFSWLYGRFDNFDGSFTYDENAPEKASIEMTVQTGSVNSNHAERDKHLRSDDFLNVAKYPTAQFVSSSFTPTKDGHGTMTGDLTINGVTNEVELDVQFVGAGDDPWGGHRRGYEATTEINLSDYKIKRSLGPSSEKLYLTVSVEGIKK